MCTYNALLSFPICNCTSFLSLLLHTFLFFLIHKALKSPFSRIYSKVSIRAFFDYNPLQDPLIPCKEVGVAFCSGDVLHVVNMDDTKWWQVTQKNNKLLNADLFS